MKTEIKSFPNVYKALEGIENLYAVFLRAHKKKAKVELFCSMTYHSDDNEPHDCSVVAYHDKTGSEEAKWMKNFYHT